MSLSANASSPIPTSLRPAVARRKAITVQFDACERQIRRGARHDRSRFASGRTLSALWGIRLRQTLTTLSLLRLIPEPGAARRRVHPL